MITKNLRVNQLTAKAYENYLAYLNAIDTKDVEAYGKFLADNITVQFNNDEPMQGKQAVLQGLGYYWQSFDSVEHDLTNIYGTDHTYVLEALNHYVRKDEKKTTVKAVAFTDLDERGLAKSVRIYQDVSPVFS
jgi:ketosteroid isomerase-like protein